MNENLSSSEERKDNSWLLGQSQWYTSSRHSFLTSSTARLKIRTSEIQAVHVTWHLLGEGATWTVESFPHLSNEKGDVTNCHLHTVTRCHSTVQRQSQRATRVTTRTRPNQNSIYFRTGEALPEPSPRGFNNQPRPSYQNKWTQSCEIRNDCLGHVQWATFGF